MKFTELFKKPLDNEPNTKWLMIGYFTGMFMLISLLFPIIIYQSILHDCGFIPIYNSIGLILICKTIIVLVPVLGYIVCWRIMINEITTFCVNISILLYRDYEKSKNKKTGMENLINVKP